MIQKPSGALYPAPSTGLQFFRLCIASHLVYRYDGVLLAPVCYWKVPHNVDAPLVEGNGAQHVDHLMRRLVSDAGIPQASVRSPDVILGILGYRRPKYPRLQDPLGQGLSIDVTTTHAQCISSTTARPSFQGMHFINGPWKDLR
ncbi:hypothetical protein LIER_06863 [Lithospermum erythrorhizon]|uniref:Uncharacterized protein n=1 Tax=Lithospermum erythrorhizon TaxID=34254 RepID=A0AAV3PAQ4_LITER